MAAASAARPTESMVFSPNAVGQPRQGQRAQDGGEHLGDEEAPYSLLERSKPVGLCRMVAAAGKATSARPWKSPAP